MRGRFCLAALLIAVLIPTALTAQDTAQAPSFFVMLFYLKPGYETEADDAARQIANLFRQKKVELGYRLFKVVLGPEMPLLIVVIGAKDPVDYATADKAHLEVLGAEGQALFQRVFAITRRFEQHGGWVRPDLSLAPVAANVKK
jgi:hypothetical protein